MDTSPQWKFAKSKLSPSKWSQTVRNTILWLHENKTELVGLHPMRHVCSSVWKFLSFPHRLSGAQSEWPSGSWSPQYPNSLSPVCSVCSHAKLTNSKTSPTPPNFVYLIGGYADPSFTNSLWQVLTKAGRDEPTTVMFDFGFSSLYRH